MMAELAKTHASPRPPARPDAPAPAPGAQTEGGEGVAARGPRGASINSFESGEFLNKGGGDPGPKKNSDGATAARPEEAPPAAQAAHAEGGDAPAAPEAGEPQAEAPREHTGDMIAGGILKANDWRDGAEVADALGVPRPRFTRLVRTLSERLYHETTERLWLSPEGVDAVVRLCGVEGDEASAAIDERRPREGVVHGFPANAYVLLVKLPDDPSPISARIAPKVRPRWKKGQAITVRAGAQGLWEILSPAPKARIGHAD